MAWLEDITHAVSEATGVDAEELELPPQVRREILDLARIASHTSGERINAPLLCYVLGAAVARGASLSDAARAVRERAGD